MEGFFGSQGLYQGPFWLTLCRLVLTLSLRWLFCEWVTATLPLSKLRAVAPPPPNPTLSWRLPLEKMTIRWGCSFWLNQSAKSNKNHYKTCAMFRWKNIAYDEALQQCNTAFKSCISKYDYTTVTLCIEKSNPVKSREFQTKSINLPDGQIHVNRSLIQ